MWLKQSSCFVSTKPWIQILVPPKNILPKGSIWITQVSSLHGNTLKSQETAESKVQGNGGGEFNYDIS
jgi:hypothetical protein